MSGRLGAALVVASIAAAIVLSPASAAPSAEAASVCPPVTIEDLFPPPATPSNTTSPDDAAARGTAVSCTPFVYEMTWPLGGEGRVISGFGAERDRGERHHQGVDIAAPKLTPVVAVADGTVIQVSGETGTEECCWVGIRHRDGWQSFYVHLNNDSYGTDDGRGTGIRSDLEVGSAVAEGEVIGWVGDSGNAEEATPHLHFELRTGSGTAIDPGPSLKAASVTGVVGQPATAWPYADQDEPEVDWVAASLLTAGLFLPCDASGLVFCPSAVAEPGFAHQIASFYSAHQPPPVDGHLQSLPGTLDPERLGRSAVERAIGCAPLETCVDYGLYETDLARLAVWVRADLSAEVMPPQANSVDGLPDFRLPSPYEAEKTLRTQGVIGSCKPPLDSTRLLTRGETLLRLVYWIGGSDLEPCRTSLATS